MAATRRNRIARGISRRKATETHLRARARAVGAANELDVAAAVLVTPVITTLLGLHRENGAKREKKKKKMS